jgi:peptide/nickel transport system permease protein
MGISYRTREPVQKDIFARFPTTLKLALYATALSTVFGILVGVISAVKQYSLMDNLSVILSLILSSMPDFWLGLVLMMTFAVKIKVFPLNFSGKFISFVLPAFAAAMPGMANLIRMTRSTMLDVLRADYVTTARAKGLPRNTVVMRHAFRNALLPLTTLIGVNFSWLLGGTIVIEQVFNIPGLGNLMLTSIRMKDTPIVMGTVLFVATLACLINLLTDLVYAYIDPRVKSLYSRQ